MAADFTISQSGGAGAGTLNTELLQVWGGLAVQLVAEPAAAYSWQVLDRPNGTAATPAAPTSGSTTITPEQTAGRWRIELTTPGGSRVVVFEVTKNVSGVALDNGLGVTPAHLERPSEAGGRGAARVFERFRTSLLSLIDASPTASKLLLRDATGKALATAFRGPSGAATKIESQATRDVHIDSENDVLVDVASEGDVVRVQVNNVDAMTVTPTVGKVAVELPNRELDLSTKGGPNNLSVNSGRDALIDHASGRATIVSENGTQVVRMQEPQTSITANTKTLTCSSDGTTFLCATDSPLRIQPSSSGVVGAGRSFTFGGSPGQTPGTHAPGASVCELGVRVGNAGGRMEFVENSVLLGAIHGGPSFANFMTVAHERINSGLMLSAGSSGSGVSIVGNQSAAITVQSATASVAVQTVNRFALQNTSGLDHQENRWSRTTISAAGSGQLVTRVLTADTGETIYVFCTVTNRTSKRTSSFFRRFVMQNNGGTGADNGADVAVVADSIATGEAGLTVTLDRSGVAARLNYNQPNGDTREYRWVIVSFPSSLV